LKAVAKKPAEDLEQKTQGIRLQAVACMQTRTRMGAKGGLRACMHGGIARSVEALQRNRNGSLEPCSNIEKSSNKKADSDERKGRAQGMHGELTVSRRRS
jgi:hypothetical protein